MKKNTAPNKARTQIPHAHVWSTLSLTSFMTTFIVAIMLGVRGIMPFAYAALALLSILLLEALLRGRLWPFDDSYRQRFIHIDGIALRLLIFSGILLLLLETGVFVMMWV